MVVGGSIGLQGGTSTLRQIYASFTDINGEELNDVCATVASCAAEQTCPTAAPANVNTVACSQPEKLVVLHTSPAEIQQGANLIDCSTMTIDQQLIRHLVGALAGVPGIERYGTRTQMLVGVPANVTRSESSHVIDLLGIIADLDRADPKSILIVIDNARFLVGDGTALDQRLLELYAQIGSKVLAAAASRSSAVAPPWTCLEKVVSRNAIFLDVARWRAQLDQMESCVCRIDRSGVGQGTGFLVGPDLVLTNHHVVAELLTNLTDVGRWSCRFDYKLSASGDVISMGRQVQLLNSNFCVDASPHSPVDLLPDPKPKDPSDGELDFALLRLAESIGNEPIGDSSTANRRWIRLSSAMVNYADQRVVVIIGHPHTRPMKLTLSMEQRIVVNSAHNRIRYTVPTDEGASGSPVFDGDFNLVAIHHGGDPSLTNPAYNEGIPTAKIAMRPKVASVLPQSSV